jgi:large subunit ribosomal protein L1
VHAPVGKASFSADRLLENTRVLIREIVRAKPTAAKGTYLQSLTISSTMGPGIAIDTQSAITETAH